MSSAGSAAWSSMAPRDRWTIAVQMDQAVWVPIYSNAASPTELYEANCDSRRSEVLLIRHDEYGNLDLKWTSARKLILNFSHHVAKPEQWKTYRCSDERITQMLQDLTSRGMTGEKAFERLCEHAEVKLPLPTLRVADNHFNLTTKDDASISNEIGNFICFSAFGMAVGSSPASDRLAEAIKAGDPTGLKKAIADGASLLKLPDSSCSPLETAMYQCGITPKWRQCVQALIDAGCSIHDGDRDPPIFAATSHIVPESTSIELLKLLLENKVDINQRNESGRTVLDLSAVYRRAAVVKFLMGHGARADLKTQGDDTIVDDIRRRVDESAQYGKRSNYADILEMLTGKPYELPPKYEPTDAEVSESKRFIQVANAKQLRSQLPASPEVQQIKASRLNRFERFADYVRDLKALGFNESCHFVVRVAMPVIQTVYTNESLYFDAVFGDDGPLGDGRLRLEICAYAEDGKILSVSNKPAEDLGDFRAPIIENHLIEDAMPTPLVNALKEIVSSRKINSIDQASAPERYTRELTRIIESIKNRTKEMERNRWVRQDGTVPRFERLKIYLQVRPGSEPADCNTKNISRSCLKTVEMYRSDKNKKRDHRDVIRNVAELMAIGHLEFAGAQQDSAAVDAGTDAALKFFESLKNSQTGDPISIVEPLTFAFAILSVHARWSEMKMLSESLTTALFEHLAREHGDPPIAYAELLGLIANLFRRKPIVDNTELYNRIEHSKDKRAIALARSVMAINDHDSVGFADSIIDAIKLAAKLKQRSSWFFDLDRVVAWYETPIWQIAKSRGLTLPELKPNWSDWILVQRLDEAR